MAITGSWRPDRTGLMVIAVCAVGVAVATLAFAALSSVLLRPLPYAEPDRIVRVVTRGDDSIANRPVSLPLARTIGERATPLEAVAVADEWDPTLVVDERAQYLVGASVSGDFFRVFGVQPSLGRLFDQRDDVDRGRRPLVRAAPDRGRRQQLARLHSLGRQFRLLPAAVFCLWPDRRALPRLQNGDQAHRAGTAFDILLSDVPEAGVMRMRHFFHSSFRDSSFNLGRSCPCPCHRCAVLTI